MTTHGPDELVIRAPRPSELQAVRQLRYEVLDADKGIALKTSSKTDDAPSSIHMAAFDDDKIICVVRLNPLADDPRTYLVRRMATTPAYRRQGIGSKVLTAAEAEAIKCGAKAFVLDARQEARDFYIRAGYRPTGQHPIHDGDINISMAKQLA